MRCRPGARTASRPPRGPGSRPHARPEHAFSSSLIRSVNPLAATSAAAFGRIPATQPAETVTPAIWDISPAARCTGMWFRAGEVRGLRVRLRPETGPRPHVRRQLSLADRLAPRALLGLCHVLPHHRRRRGLDIGDLVAALRDDRGIRQVRAALRGTTQAGTTTGRSGSSTSLHRGSRLARLLARPPLPPLPQRPVPRPSSDMGCPTMAASTTWKNPCPHAAPAAPPVQL